MGIRFKFNNNLKEVSDITIRFISATFWATVTIAVSLIIYKYIANGNHSLETSAESQTLGLMGIGLIMCLPLFLIFILPGALLCGLPIAFYLGLNYRTNLIAWILGGFAGALFYKLLLHIVITKQEFFGDLGLIGGPLSGFYIWCSIMKDRVFSKLPTHLHAAPETAE